MGCKYAIPVMSKSGQGSIINISSISGLMGNPGQVNYASSKAALSGFTKSLAKEVGSRNITVNSVAPGYIDTDMTSFLDANAKEKILNKINYHTKFYNDEMSPNIEDWVNKGVVSKTFWEKAGYAGIMSGSVSEEYGGVGGDMGFDSITVYEQSKTGDSSCGYGLQFIFFLYFLF